jgi:uncharacterized protein HemX
VEAPVIVGLIGAAAAIGTGLIAWVSARRGSQMTAMSKWIDQLQASEAAAKREAHESSDRADRIKKEADADVKTLRTDLDGIHQQLRSAKQMIEAMTDQLLQVQAEVWRPEPDLEALRRLVGRPAPGSLNGR